MAIAVLSPWPSTPAAVTAAVACLKAEITALSSLSDDSVSGLGATAAALVEKFAPDAPAAIKREGVIRTAGYLIARRPQPYSSFSVGPIRLDHKPERMVPDALRHSGARALLAPFRARRALPAVEATA